jgi:hypothetical protein
MARTVANGKRIIYLSSKKAARMWPLDGVIAGAFWQEKT